MRVLAWNTQGSKWDRAYELAIAGRALNVTANQASDTVMVLSEAGWAPWVEAKSVAINRSYAYDPDHPMMIAGDFLTAADQRQCTAFWLPWVTDPAAVENGYQSNSRCSLGVIWKPAAQPNGYSMRVRSLLQQWQGVTSRPIAMVVITNPIPNVCFWIALVHLVSGYPAGASAQVREILRLVRQTYPAVPGMVVGDFNINLQSAPDLARLQPLPRFWSLVRIGVPTQMSGGELDFALFYNPRLGAGGGAGGLPAASVGAYWQQDKAPIALSDPARLQPIASGSDHAALMYGIPDV